MFTIQQEESETKGLFFIDENGTRVAELTYSKAGSDRIIIDHTHVAEHLRGQDAGKQMVLEAVNYARKNRIKIIPLCPFARSVFNRNPALGDVL